jgi:signal transduction histidine kinase
MSEPVHPPLDVRAAQDRLRGLLRANQSIISDLAIEVVLRRIVEAACELLEARFGALGVLSPDRLGLEQFIHVGIDQETVDLIGDLPQGKGVLGALIDDPAPIRLHRLSDDVRSVGFPENHPPMSTFLGVPITIRGEVFGNLYLTEKIEGDFTEEDVELASALAATAAVAIENARLFEDARRRQQWLSASTGVSVEIATATGTEPLRSIAEHVHRLARADVVTLVLPDVGKERLTGAVAVGLEAARLTGSSYPVAGTLTEGVLNSGASAMVTGLETEDGSLHLRDLLPIGPAMVLPLAGPDRIRGALVVGRLASGRAFSESEMEMATTFANQASLALELAESRERQDRMHLFEERDRIARDLHDHVIQQLFAAGMTLQGIAMGIGESVHSTRISGVVDSLDHSIRQIRNSIFELRDHVGPQGPGVRAAVLDVVAEISGLLGFDPEVRFAGPVDTIVGAGMAEDIIAVVREALTNVARHAQATSVEISLTASTERVELRVADNGQGMGVPARRSGLDNMASRAAGRDGVFSTSDQREGTGTVLLWAAPALG